ncbi:lipase, putative [Talaromyces stipitatus ATCC 10500]|uniref:sn-1-specific diacylglycerol lipase n=1 Tax=Talaromyces stipitatus (strain ATCC 10500 / CBS 375.48 / QM 6759 / NRRL 1006) TaxID=441959 RepID=B8MKL7_TALSN|nr:lipase, putative [Talaromyces stipitatus ATCC 10500]EED15372.1 lipase, putative [Talaromyces stipitatus ATCC 10500]
MPRDRDTSDELNISEKQHEEDKTSSNSLITSAAKSASTLLPQSIASAVSFITQSTSLSLRIGTFFGGAALGSARVTTLTGLELSRVVVEAILTRAGRDVAGHSHGEYGRLEAESLLERSLAALHSTVTSTSFFAAAGFHLSEVALSSLSNLSQNLLYTLDSILGSTESSRAIAAIITLIRREFSKKEEGEDNAVVGVGDLLVGSVGFALLQRWGRLNSERHLRETEGEVTIWDVVILDNGLRADVIGTQTTGYAQNMLNDAVGDRSRPASFMDPGVHQQSIDALERVHNCQDAHPWNPSTDVHNQLSDEDIRNYIMSQLPQGSRASVRTELVTARTITVDIFDDDVAEIAAPPGTMMIEERFHHDQESQDAAKRLPKHTVVFQTTFNKSQSTDLRTEAIANENQKTENVAYRITDITDADKTNPGEESSQDASRPIFSENHANEGRRRPRRITSSSSLSGSETPRNTFGKASLSKITQKVRVGQGEKSALKSKDTTKKTQGKGSSVLSKANKVPRNGPQRKYPAGISENQHPRSSKGGLYNPTLASLNRSLPPIPVGEYPRYRSTPSPTASRMPQPNRAPSRAGLFHPDEDTESFVTHTDSYSIHSIDSRPGSAAYTRTHIRSSSSMSRTRPEDAQKSSKRDLQPPGSPQTHRRSRSFVPSIYSMATGSETSLILAPRPRKSVYEDESTIIGLNRNGLVPGIFPHNHLVKNIRRFCRFSSASYGSNALKVMGVQHDQKRIQYHDPENIEHSSFSNMTGLPQSTILLSSYVDPAGGTNSAGETESGFPLVHYLFLDHESKAVVLALRGTWGFEDILTDMTCDYDDLEWQGKNWKVHKGMHASAKRLLEGGGKRVMATIKAALEEFPDYGVIFCGHSLGGGVAALLATMISQPNADTSGPSFVTASALQATEPLLLTASHQQEATKAFSLPPDRPIHVYAFGPPACMSPFLRRATRGLVTTVVNGKDVVPCLSLGILHDLRAVALSFKKDTTDSKSHIRSRVWDGLRQSILNKFYVNQPPIPINAGEGLGEDTWAWSTLQSLRDEMIAPKLVPPGEVFIVDTMRVLQRNAFMSSAGLREGESSHPQLGRPATRVQLKFIRNVETYFGEMKFSSGMLGDHNPVRYEASLAALARGTIDD